MPSLWETAESTAILGVHRKSRSQVFGPSECFVFCLPALLDMGQNIRSRSLSISGKRESATCPCCHCEPDLCLRVRLWVDVGSKCTAPGFEPKFKQVMLSRHPPDLNTWIRRSCSVVSCRVSLDVTPLRDRYHLHHEGVVCLMLQFILERDLQQHRLNVNLTSEVEHIFVRAEEHATLLAFLSVLAWKVSHPCA